ncbi:MAG: hypothetical protein ACRD19_09410 [Terriglobia bacterium]
MSRKNRKQLVVDVNLVYASGDLKFNPTFDPVQSNSADRSRHCLQAIWEEEHIAVFSSSLREEWNRHARHNKYVQKWLERMAVKGRILEEDGERFANLASPASACLATEAQGAMKKDFHLVQSALASGQLVLSNEARFPQHVAVACGAVEELLRLHYGNPAVEGESCRLWIKAGAEKVADRRIDVWVKNHCAAD